MKLEELARLAGVSKATASIILNGHAARYRISQKTCDKVITLARKHQYVANAQAAGLRNSSSKLVALILPDLLHHGFAILSKHLEKLSRESGYQLVIACSDDSPETEIEVVKSLTGRKVEAIIAVSTLTDDDIYQQAEKRGVAVILLDRCQPQANLDYIISDDRQAALALTTLLLKNRPDTIVYFGGKEALINSQLRLEGFQQAVKEYQHGSIKTDIYHQDFSVESGYRMISDYFNTFHRLPDTLFTSSFTLMEGVLQFSRKHMDSMPTTINWCTFGDSYILDLLPFNIHSARQCYQEMAQEALLMLDRKKNRQDYLHQRVLTREVIGR